VSYIRGVHFKGAFQVSASVSLSLSLSLSLSHTHTHTHTHTHAHAPGFEDDYSKAECDCIVSFSEIKATEHLTNPDAARKYVARNKKQMTRCALGLCSLGLIP
jgi:hypothetical protein